MILKHKSGGGECARGGDRDGNSNNSTIQKHCHAEDTEGIVALSIGGWCPMP